MVLILMTKCFSENRFRQGGYKANLPRIKTKVDSFSFNHVGLPWGNLAVTFCDCLGRNLNGAGSYSATKRLLSIPDPPGAMTWMNADFVSRALRVMVATDLGARKGNLACTRDGRKCNTRSSKPSLVKTDQPIKGIANYSALLLMDQISGQAPQDKSSFSVLSYLPVPTGIMT